MSKNLSAVKKTRIAARNRFSNKVYKSNIKTLTKKYLNCLKNLESNNQDKQLEYLSAVYSKIDKAVKKGVLHKNNGARKKSMLTKMMKKNTNIS